MQYMYEIFAFQFSHTSPSTENFMTTYTLPEPAISRSVRLHLTHLTAARHPRLRRSSLRRKSGGMGPPIKTVPCCGR